MATSFSTKKENLVWCLLTMHVPGQPFSMVELPGCWGAWFEMVESHMDPRQFTAYRMVNAMGLVGY
jgi:hypothetical protein